MGWLMYIKNTLHTITFGRNNSHKKYVHIRHRFFSICNLIWLIEWQLIWWYLFTITLCNFIIFNSCSWLVTKVLIWSVLPEAIAVSYKDTELYNLIPPARSVTSLSCLTRRLQLNSQNSFDPCLLWIGFESWN